jgi:hypothetical protein
MRKKKEEQRSSILKFLPPSPSTFRPFPFSPYPSTTPFLLHHSTLSITTLKKTNKRMSYKWMKKLAYSSTTSYYGTVPRIHNPDTPVTWQ